jgi:hypothetical protein
MSVAGTAARTPVRIHLLGVRRKGIGTNSGVTALRKRLKLMGHIRFFNRAQRIRTYNFCLGPLRIDLNR